MQIRKPETDELAVINAMIMHSKAHWGYDEMFLEQCRSELTFDKARLRSEYVRISYLKDTITGIVQLEFEPERMGARQVGKVRSGSIANHQLPLLLLDL